MNTLQSLKQEAVKEFETSFAYKFHHEHGCSFYSDTAAGPICTCGVMKGPVKLLTTWLEKAYEAKITEDTSDGYHTFKELYEFRKLYNAALFNEWANKGIFEVHKSKRHHNGEECFGGGWFIVMAQLPTGQISNHYELKDWDLFQCEEREKANEWDDHTAQDVANRLRDFINSTKEAK